MSGGTAPEIDERLVVGLDITGVPCSLLGMHFHCSLHSQHEVRYPRHRSVTGDVCDVMLTSSIPSPIQVIMA